MTRRSSIWQFTGPTTEAALHRREPIARFTLDVNGQGLVHAVVKVFVRESRLSDWYLLATLTAAGLNQCSSNVEVSPGLLWIDHYAACTTLTGESAVAVVSVTAAA